MKYKVSVIKKIAFLVMTMALAVAMVACSGAAGTPGPAGPAGPPGEPGTTDPTDPTTSVEPGPVQMIKGIDPFIFNDSATGDINKEPTAVNVSGSFYPSAGLDFSISGHSKAKMERFTAEVSEDGLVTVTLKASDYQNDKIGMKATDGTSSDTIDFYVRRNRPPKNASTGTRNVDTIGAPTVLSVWVTEEDLDVPAHNVNAMGDAPDTHIPIVIGKLKTGPDAIDTSEHDQMPYFFHDDEGNKLSFVSDLSVGAAKRLMVIDGEMKVTLKGLKTTYYDDSDDDTDNPTEIGIELDVSTVDDNGMGSEDEETVLNIYIDTAPNTKGTIGTKVITLGTTTMDKVAVRNVASYFTDDRHNPVAAADGTTDNLEYYVWSDDSKVATVSVNSGNDKAMVVSSSWDAGVLVNGAFVADGFYVEGKGRGTAMIMVKAQETKGDAARALFNATTGAPSDNAHAREKQSVTLIFMVEVN